MKTRTYKQAQAALRTAIFEGKYSKPKSRMIFEKCVNEIYLPWSKNNKRSYPNDVTTAKVACEFFRGQANPDLMRRAVRALESLPKNQPDSLTSQTPVYRAVQ